MANIACYTDAAGNKRYYVQYRTPEKKHTKKRGFTSKLKAREWAEDIESSKRRSEFINPTAGKASVREVGQAWLNAQKVNKPSTYRALESSWRVHVEPRWGDIPLSSVQASDVQDWITDMSKRRSASTVQRCHGILAGLLDRAVLDRKIPRNTARDGIKLPSKAPKPRVYLTHEQVDDLAREAGEHETLIYLLAYTGLRWGEAVGLRVKHLDLLRKRIQVEENAVQLGGSKIVVGTPKTWERRSVRFPEFLAIPLARACDGKSRDDLVFCREDGSHLRRPRSVSEKDRRPKGGWFEYAVERAGIPRVTPHDLRHTAASIAISAGANPKGVQRMLGHKSAAMTLDTYADLFDADLEAVAKAVGKARLEALRSA